jgi:S-formylglutathione hydrolase FrmB
VAAGGGLGGADLIRQLYWTVPELSVKTLEVVVGGRTRVRQATAGSGDRRWIPRCGGDVAVVRPFDGGAWQECPWCTPKAPCSRPRLPLGAALLPGVTTVSARSTRSRVATLALVVSLVTAMAPPVQASYPAPDPAAGPIEPSGVRWVSDRLVELSFDNARVDPPYSPTKVRILVPEGARAKKGWQRCWRDDWRSCWRRPGREYPVVFLFHGGGDRYDGWTTKHDGWGPLSLEEFTEHKDVVVVMPDAGDFGDTYTDGEWGAPEWETWHIGQLVPWVKRSLPVRRDRGGWVVAGLSWGGFGTMSYLARHPDLFAAGFAFSGALDVRGLIQGRFGPGEVFVQGHNPTDLVDNLRDSAAIWFRTGQGVAGGPAPLDNHPVGIGLEAAVWYTNESFRLALEQEGLEYHYEAVPQAAHNWWHWHDGFQNYAWPAMEEVFSRDIPEIPDDFHYRTIQPRFDIYGWDVAVERDAVEFLTLDDVDARSLTVTGSGMVTIVTPSRYEPRAAYRVSATTERSDTASGTVEVVRADRRGRLRFTVDLGPSHRYQQFTPEQIAAESADPDYWRTAEVEVSRR